MPQMDLPDDKCEPTVQKWRCKNSPDIHVSRVCLVIIAVHHRSIVFFILAYGQSFSCLLLDILLAPSNVYIEEQQSTTNQPSNNCIIQARNNCNKKILLNSSCGHPHPTHNNNHYDGNNDWNTQNQRPILPRSSRPLPRRTA